MGRGDSIASGPSFRAYANLPFRDYSYEPFRLWLILILLRSREQYYEEAIQQTRSHVERLWDQVGGAWARDKFESAHTVEIIWQRSAPPWWELNDIVGFIDVRVHDRSNEIWTSLFLPKKRISRRLQDKIYWFQRKETFSIPDDLDNGRMQQMIIANVRQLRGDVRLKKLYVDLDRWETLVRHTDLAGIIRELRRG